MVIRAHTRNAALPDLTAIANARIHAVEMRATDLLLREIAEAFQPFNDAEARAKAGNATLTERVTSLRTAQRAYRNARINAYRMLFEAVASEYFNVDNHSEAYSDRLRYVVVPAVRRAFPLPDDDRLISAAIRTFILEWESRRSGQIPPRPVDASWPETPAQTIDLLRTQKGWTIEQLADHAGLDTKQLYKVKRGEVVRTDTILTLAAALGCEAGDLLPRNPIPKRG